MLNCLFYKNSHSSSKISTSVLLGITGTIPGYNKSSLILRVKFLSSSNLVSSVILIQNPELLLPLVKVTLYGPAS